MNAHTIRFIQRRLGYADVPTTWIYTQAAIRKLKERLPAKVGNTVLDELKVEIDDYDG